MGLEKINVPIIKNSKLVRGLDYYNCMCFEIKIKDREKKQ